MKKVEISDTFTFHGKDYTVDEFATAYAEGDIDKALDLANILYAKGKVIIRDNSTPEEKVFKKVQGEVDIVSQANAADQEQEAILDYQAAQKREGRMTYPKIELDYPSSALARIHGMKFIKELRLQEEQININSTISGKIVMTISDITDAEFNAICRIYKTDKIINSAMSMATKASNTVVGGFNFGTEKIAVPTLDLGIKTGMGILRGLSKVVVKTGSTLITSAMQSAKQTASEVADDPDVLRARRELIETKDAIKRKIGNVSNSGGNGIKIFNN